MRWNFHTTKLKFKVSFVFPSRTTNSFIPHLTRILSLLPRIFFLSVPHRTLTNFLFQHSHLPTALPQPPCLKFCLLSLTAGRLTSDSYSVPRGWRHRKQRKSKQSRYERNLVIKATHGEETEPTFFAGQDVK